MQDRPTLDELIETVVHFLEERVMVGSDGAMRFQGRVAVNALKIVRRELALDEAHSISEWSALQRLLALPATIDPRDRSTVRHAITAANEELCERLRRGDADRPPFRDEVRRHLRMTVRQKLEVSNPKWLSSGKG